MLTVRSESQFNTVVYDTNDRYRGISGKNVVLMSKKDMAALELPENGQVTIKNTTGDDDRAKSHRLPH